jgi:hypothetical protein
LVNFISGTVTSDVTLEISTTAGSGLQLSGSSDVWGAREIAPAWADPLALADRMWVNQNDAATLRIHSLQPGALYDVEIASSFAGSGTAGVSPGRFVLEDADGPVTGFNAWSGTSLGTQVEWTSRGPNDGGGSGAAEGWMLWPEVPADSQGEIRIHLSAPFGTLSRISLNAMRVAVIAPLDIPDPGSIEEWRQLYFGTTGNTGQADDSANPTRDGIPNFMKFALGMNPLAAATGHDRAIVSFQRDGSQSHVDVRIPDGLNRPGLRYHLERSIDLAAWTPIAEAVDGPAFTALPDQPVSDVQRIGGVVRITLDPAAPGPCFFRLHVSTY